jgi:Lrp/AsnC family leucine-responsive transcriptional regulator
MSEEHLIEYGEKVRLTENDKKILKLLDKNARMLISEISRRTGIQRDSVLYRIKRMEKLKVIRFYHTVLNPSILGCPIYTFVNIVLHNIDEETEKSLVSFLRQHPNIVYVAKTTGKWDFTICIAAKSLKNFDEIITQIRLKFSRVIKDFETSSIIQEYKYDYMVDLI